MEDQEEEEAVPYSELQKALDMLKMVKEKPIYGSGTQSDFMDMSEAKNYNFLSSSDDISTLHKDICSYSLR